MKASICTLGCKVNQFESDAVIRILENNGYEICGFDSFCDIYIINTCTVTGISDRKSRQMIRRAKKINPNSIVIAMGCLAQTDTGQLIKDADIIIGTKHKYKIMEHIEKFKKENTQINIVLPLTKEDKYENSKVNTFKPCSGQISKRVFLKIQDGCNQYCSYCIIPYARGYERSMSVTSVIEQINRLENCFEVVLSGINLSSYGKDINTDIFELIGEIEKNCKIERIRLGSISPLMINERCIEAFKASKKLCAHFHISLQSGSDLTLKRMNRKYTTADYREKVKTLRENFNGCAITTDIMVGFPGETVEEFFQTLDFIREIEFSDAHVFKYSKRAKTKAALMENQIPANIKELRSKEVIGLIEDLRLRYINSFLGTSQTVLIEQEKDGLFEGLTSNYIRVYTKNPPKTLCNIKLEKIFKEGAKGICI